jgi:hypothetical protein
LAELLSPYLPLLLLAFHFQSDGRIIDAAFAFPTRNFDRARGADAGAHGAVSGEPGARARVTAGAA